MHGVDAIVHCAGIASPENIEPVELFEVNALTTFNALEEAWKAGVRTAVLASSGSIYGTAWAPEELDIPSVPIDEKTELRYVDPYALTKDVLERMGQMYARRGMQVTALRLHWILTPDEVLRWIADVPPEDNRRNLWGYVDLSEAARACLLALEPRTTHHPALEPRVSGSVALEPRDTQYAALVLAAEDTGRREPTEQLLRDHYPNATLDRPLPGTSSPFDSSRAAEMLGWHHHSTWRS
jgi:nucleoside-diphosphate-sugar epimerase